MGVGDGVMGLGGSKVIHINTAEGTVHNLNIRLVYYSE